MKRILLAAGLGLGVLTFTMAGTINHATAPQSQLIYDTVPGDTTKPPAPTDTTTTPTTPGSEPTPTPSPSPSK
jgi:hypothetical protein